MKPGGIKHSCLAWLLALACISVDLHAAVPHAVADALRARAASQGEVRLIVQFAASGKGFAELPAAARQSRQQQIANLQAHLASRAVQPGMRELVRFRTIPFMVFSADAHAVDRLANLPEVIGLQEDIPEYPTLASSIPVIGADTAWTAGYDGTGQVIAVLDTGVDTSHPYFPPGKLVAEACFSSSGAGDSESLCPGQASSSTAPGSGQNCTLPICEHGSHVAGIAVGNNGVGPNIGVAKGARLITIQVFSCTTGSNCPTTGILGSYPSDQVRALEHVMTLSASHNIAAVNMSLGGALYTDQADCDEDNAARKAAIDNLRAVGIATIIASGNDNSKNGIRQPGCISSAISVGNTTDNDLIYDASQGSNVATFLDLLAPGTSINSAAPGGLEVSNTGTSMATPHVAGAWAVLRQAHPAASIDDILQALQLTGTSVDDQRSGGTVTDMRRINLGLGLDAMTVQLPEIETDPPAGSPFDFGTVFVGEPGPVLQVTVGNSGTSSLSLACDFTGLAAASYQASQCPDSIPAGQSGAVQFACVPLTTGEKVAQLRLLTDDSDESEILYPLTCTAEWSPDNVFTDSFEEPLP